MTEHPTLATVEQWSNDPALARANLRQLLPLVADSDESFIQWSSEALENCAAPDIQDRSWLIEQLKGSERDVVYWASTLLGRLGSYGTEAIPHLQKLVEDPETDGNVRRRATWALQQITTVESSVPR